MQKLSFAPVPVGSDNSGGANTLAIALPDRTSTDFMTPFTTLNFTSIPSALDKDGFV